MDFTPDYSDSLSDSELKDNIYKKISKKSEKSKAHFLLEIKGKLRK